MRVFTIAILFLSSLGSFGQNLVPNADFEDYISCPDDYCKNEYVQYTSNWDSPNAGTPDYFNACSYKCGVPINWVGSAQAFSGKAYMGIIACMKQIDKNQIAYREYIRVKLTDSLKAGKEYFAAMHVQLGKSCNISCNGLGMYFSANAMNSNQKFNMPVDPQVFHSKIIDNKNAWQKVCGKFVANGGENYLIIGNFLSNQNMIYKNFDENLLETQHTTPSAYYFIDGVEVFEYSDSLNYECPSIEDVEVLAFDGELKRDTKIVLDNLYFEIDKAAILKQSFYELDKLVLSLKKNSQLKINIHGYTDNTGSVVYNQELSVKRAKAVYNYLLNKGISKFRMTFQGFGDSKPVNENSTEEGKRKNRRVEIEVF